MIERVIAGALVAVLAAGCSGGADAEDAAESPAASSSTTTSTTAAPPTTTTAAPTTTVAPEPEPDGEGFDIDREFSPDAEAENLGPIGSTETTIPTDEGEISVGGGDVPELGEGFPLPDGFEIQITTEVEGEIGFSGRVDAEFDELLAFYDEALPAAGYEIVDRQEVSGVFATLTVDGPLAGDVVISREPGVDAGWTVLIALADPAG